MFTFVTASLLMALFSFTPETKPSGIIPAEKSEVSSGRVRSAWSFVNYDPPVDIPKELRGMKVRKLGLSTLCDPIAMCRLDGIPVDSKVSDALIRTGLLDFHWPPFSICRAEEDYEAPRSYIYVCLGKVPLSKRFDSFVIAVWTQERFNKWKIGDTELENPPFVRTILINCKKGKIISACDFIYVIDQRFDIVKELSKNKILMYS